MVALSSALVAVIVGYSPVHTGVDVPRLTLAMLSALALFGGFATYIQRHDMRGEGLRTIIVWFVDLRRLTVWELALVAGTVLATTLTTVAFGTVGRMLADGSPSEHSATTGVGSGGIDPAVLAVVVLMAVVVGPVLEELLFRNGIQKILAEWTGTPLAVLATSALFATFHVSSYGGFAQPVVSLAVPILSVFTASVLYGFMYAWTGNVAVAMLAHGAHNGLALLTLV